MMAHLNNKSSLFDTEIFWHALDSKQISDLIQTDLYSGLTSEQVEIKQEKFGLNQLEKAKTKVFWKKFLEELTEPLMLLLIVTGLAYLVLQDVFDGVVIFCIILLLNTIEVVNERRAFKAIAALHKLAEPTAVVMRDNNQIEIPVERLVVGDIILLHSGQRVPADIRLTECYGLTVDESTLTGESMPIDKDSTSVFSETRPLAERQNMVYTGTLITKGRGKGIIIGTGMNTELGKIVGLTQHIREPRTILQKAMKELSTKLVWIALFFSIIIPILGVVIAKEPLDVMIITGLSLAFATIPEELPIIITMVLALGSYKLSKQHVIVKKLQVIETLGTVTTIATDKTGTLTKNELEIVEFYPPTEQELLLQIGLICNESILEKITSFDDPLEAALVSSAPGFEVDVKKMIENYHHVQEYPFDTTRKLMSVITDNGQTNEDKNYHIWVKGSPEQVLQNSITFNSETTILEKNNEAYLKTLNKISEMAGRGLRVIALAKKDCKVLPDTQDQTEMGLTFIGLIGFFDKPRKEVKDAIQLMQQAGVQTVMITGDHPLTAQALAHQIGLDHDTSILTGSEIDDFSIEQLQQAVREVHIFARTTPEQKLKIVTSLQENGECVAVTGDGINDAPALVKADIGIAMGKSGSDTARESADLILTDDNYSSFTNAVHEGRRLYENLQKGVRYYLTIKVALVLIMLFPILLKMPVTFAPIQIITMELFMDLAAAITFVVEPEEGDIMKFRPRDPNHPFMDTKMIFTIFLSAFLLFLVVSIVYIFTWVQNKNILEAQTVAFVSWMIGHIFLGINMRTEREPIIRVGLFSNTSMIVWAIVSFAVVLLVTSISLFNPILKVTPLKMSQWIIIILIAFIGTFWIEISKLITFKQQTK